MKYCILCIQMEKNPCWKRQLLKNQTNQMIKNQQKISCIGATIFINQKMNYPMRRANQSAQLVFWCIDFANKNYSTFAQTLRVSVYHSLYNYTMECQMLLLQLTACRRRLQHRFMSFEQAAKAFRTRSSLVGLTQIHQLTGRICNSLWHIIG